MKIYLSIQCIPPLFQTIRHHCYVLEFIEIALEQLFKVFHFQNYQSLQTIVLLNKLALVVLQPETD